MERGEEVAPGMIEIFLPQQRLIDGKVFPRVFEVAPSGCDGEFHEEAVFGVNKAFVEEQVAQHGAVLVRGVGGRVVKEARDLSEKVVGALGWPSVSYVGSAPRIRVVGSDGPPSSSDPAPVYTANEADPSVVIDFHHEMAQITGGWPGKVLFFCETPAIEGGETPIALSHKITEHMWAHFPHFMHKLDELGLLYIKILPPLTDLSQASLQGWHVLFGTTDRQEAEKRAMAKFGARVHWLPNNRLKMITGPFKATRNFGPNGGSHEVASWFNMIAMYHHSTTKDGCIDDDQPYNVTFGDGSPLPNHVVEGCKRLHEEFSVAIPWCKGDLMIVDNFVVMHGRRAFKPPRKVLVILCK